jgi:hypothetical protein
MNFFGGFVLENEPTGRGIWGLLMMFWTLFGFV